VALCAQPFGWRTLVEVTKTLLLPNVTVKEREGGEGGVYPLRFPCNGAMHEKAGARGPA